MLRAGQSMKNAVMSLEVKALVAPPKVSIILRICFSLRCVVVPPATTCSSTWLSPAPRYRPSKALPVFFTKQRTVATGATWFSWTITVRPLSSVASVTFSGRR